MGMLSGIYTRSLLLVPQVFQLPSSSTIQPPFRRQAHMFGFFDSFRPVRDRGLDLVLAGLPLLDKGQELGLAGDVFAQDLGDGETVGSLVVFEDAAECAFGCADYRAISACKLILRQQANEIWKKGEKTYVYRSRRERIPCA